MADTISINNVLYGAGQPRKGPSNIECEKTGYGAEWRAGNAQLGQAVDGDTLKRKWTLTWDKVPLATRAAVSAASDNLDPFPFIDQDGISWTVQCPLSGRFREGIAVNADDGSKLCYGVTLVFEQE